MDQRSDVTRRPDGRQEEKEGKDKALLLIATNKKRAVLCHVQLVGQGRHNRHKEDKNRRTKENVNIIGKKRKNRNESHNCNNKVT